MSILECINLNKSYGSKRVLNAMNIDIPAGKIIGLLGPNGCGKTTLIKLISGLLTPDSGIIKIDGITASPENNALISYLPERTYLNTNMKVCEMLSYFNDFYDDFDMERAYKMLSDLQIDPSTKIRALSKGTREKVQLIMVMSRNTKLYLLDEPIAGVDPACRDYILETIMQNRHPGSTILITTHLIHDIEKALDEFVFFGYGGEIVMSGNCETTRETYKKTIDELFREVFRYVQ